MARPKLVTKEQVVDALSRWFIRNSGPPTVEELRRLLGVGSTRTVLRYLDDLKEEGYIDRWSGARGLRMRKGSTAKGLETRLVPIVGEVPAGQLMPAEEDMLGQVQLPKEFLKPPAAKFFLLRVRGDSMNRAKVEGQTIDDGDLVLVRQQERANPGKIVVALVDGEATIKRLAKAPGYYVLQPASTNPKHRPIIVAQDFRVQGIVCRVFKKGG
ncbi:MAG TPA: transcriptional repressor LexA, partial [Candidatus Binatia bacterium]|nr:transcriptional repressor LexA [Candidatus Binatia bacterium]